MLRLSKLGGTTFGTLNMKFLYLPTITTSDSSWTQKVWASDKSAGPRNSFITTSKSIIIKTKLTELLMSYFNTLKGALRRKRLFEQRSSKSCTTCSFPWLMPASQASALQPSCRHSTKSLSVKPTSYPSFDNFGITSKAK